ncbi:hypothetical protein [Helicoverpa armigera nucleopolyhedrovirus]|uniref:Uncharacterized protein n=1 Tax=Helicoverpa armigera nucleopolyhedrovirus TaxID=51313 RepID=Q91BV0_9ABAC|nr:hypothetical protein [Helicoverpa armigera nucleopolyhedrovirus]AAK96350.1 unknown [Helicoverpa armigera nucleopolyhedrovirus]
MSSVRCVIVTLLALATVGYYGAFKSAIAIPATESMKQISLRVHNNYSTVETNVELLQTAISLAIAIVLSIVFRNFDAVCVNTRLLGLSALGMFLDLTLQIYLAMNTATVSLTFVYVATMTVALFGGVFLLELCLLDLVIALMYNNNSSSTSKATRCDYFKWIVHMRCAKLLGQSLVQLIPPLFEIDENQMLHGVAAGSVTSFVLAIVALNIMTPAHMFMDDYNVSDIIETYRAVPFDNDANIYRPTTLVQSSTTLTNVKSTRNNRFYVKYLIAILIYSMYESQQSELKFSYYFQKDTIMLPTRDIRILNGCQYIMFAVMLWPLVTLASRNNSTLYVNMLYMSLACNILARIIQSYAWYSHETLVWIVSVVASAPGPIAGALMQTLVYKLSDNNGHYSNLIAITADRCLSVIFILLYQCTVYVEHFSPFLITLCSLIAIITITIVNTPIKMWLKDIHC